MYKLILALLLSIPAFGAVTITTIHEVMSTGNTANSGCFDPGVGSPGTDRSQQTGIQVTYTDLTLASDTTATSALNPITSADVGNCYLIGTAVSGVCTAQTVVLLSQSGGVGTFSTDLGDTGAVCNAVMGGAKALPQQAAVIAGNIVYLKATAAYTITTNGVLAADGTAGNPIAYIGYTTTRGDNGYATFQSSTNSAEIFDVTGDHIRLVNVIAERTGGTTVRGFVFSVTGSICKNCRAVNTTSNGFEFAGGPGLCIDCWASGVTGGSAFLATGAGYPRCIGCVASGGTATGFTFAASDTEPTMCLRCISANNTGSAHGFSVTGTSPVTFSHIVAYGNAGSGVSLTASQGQIAILNSVFYGNGAYGVTSTTNLAASGTLQVLMDYNAYGTNTTADRNQVPVGPNDKDLDALGGNPFVDAASMNFALDASGLTDLRGGGFPGVLQSGGTGYASIGALEPQNTGSGGGQKGFTWISQ